MKISVVVPAYNEEKYIRSCIESLVKQDYEDFEVIVSLNACTDNTDGVVRGIMDEYEASEVVKIVHEDENSGCLRICARQLSTRNWLRLHR